MLYMQSLVFLFDGYFLKFSGFFVYLFRFWHEEHGCDDVIVPLAGTSSFLYEEEISGKLIVGSCLFTRHRSL